MKHKKTLEDYLKNIYLITKNKGYACNSDLAEVLDVTRPTVSVALKDIEKLGYISMNERREVTLTEAGRKIALKTYERNSTCPAIELSLLP